MSITNYEFKRDYADAVRREKSQPPWRCLRHSRPNEVLSEANRSTVGVLTVTESQYGTKYWNNGERDVSGWQYGVGYMAWAKDFPVGTKLIIAADIELPAGHVPPPPPTPPEPEPTYYADRVELD